VRQLGASSASMAAGSRAPPAKPRAPTWASVFDDPSGTVDLVQAVTHRAAARVSIFAGQNLP
jgi:hypothetical protein